MTNNKILCSADEYAWMEDCLKSAQRAYEFATTKAKPNTALAASAPKHKARALSGARRVCIFPLSSKRNSAKSLAPRCRYLPPIIPSDEGFATVHCEREYTLCRPHNIMMKTN